MIHVKIIKRVYKSFFMIERNIKKITSIKKGKKNTYLITTSKNETISFFDDLIVKYHILPKKEITEDELNLWKKENSKLESYYQGIHYLSIKMRTKKEIRQYLSKNNYDKETIEKTIQKMEQEGFLNEENYIQAYINDAFRFSNDGPLKLKQKLWKEELSEKKIEEGINQIETEQWLLKLEKLMQKKANSKHTDGLKKWKQKCMNYFYQLGYSLEWIEEISNRINWTEDEKTIEREYEKLKQKWSRKLKGETLILQIKKKLYEKGFQKEQIEDLIQKKIL